MRRWILLGCFFFNAAFAGNLVLPETFRCDNYHYTINHPSNWKCVNRGNGLLVCRGVDHVSINIQTIYTKAGGGKYPDVKALMDDFYKQVPKNMTHSHFLERKPFTLIASNGATLKGEQTMLTFKEDAITYKHWQIMLVSEDGLLFQAWAYRAPENEFDKYLGVAQEMLTSWKITN